MNGIHALIKETPERSFLLLPCEVRANRWLSMNWEVGPHQDESAGTLILDFPDSRTVSNKCLLLKPLSIWYFFFFFWLCWVFVSVRGLSLVAASGGHSSSRCAGLSLSRPLLLRSTGSRRAGSVVVAHGTSCSAACGILPDQGSNPCPLHWQADSQPLRHQGSPVYGIFVIAARKD